jgi:DNA polymerase-3 subunit delta'|uniref:DNA polymerase III subunit delta n=1 Tax=Desulfobacca acetoxidans TaxID=60893 RepID=A0A7V6DQ53_9BACT
MTREAASQTPAPRFFRDILGQERVLTYLKSALSRGRLAHAYLFLGPEGVGKESVARALAGALNCVAPLKDGDACGVCPSCKRLAAGTHPDYLVIRPTSKERPPKIVIEQIREFRRVTAYPPVAGGWRVTLIKPGEDMRDDTANALLKTLEEPPARHLLILTAGVEANLFPTVVSRCQKLAFTPLPYPVITRELIRRDLTPSQAALVAALSGGSLGRALSLEPEELLRQRQQVLDALQALSQGNLTTALDWAETLAKKEKEKEKEFEKAARKEGQEAKKAEGTDTVILLIQLWYRDLLVLSAGAPARLVAHQDRLADLQSEAANHHQDVWLAKLAALNAAQRQLRANLNPELTLDLLGFRLQE